MIDPPLRHPCLYRGGRHWHRIVPGTYGISLKTFMSDYCNAGAALAAVAGRERSTGMVHPMISTELVFSTKVSRMVCETSSC